jgi:L-alanine-DL-glutamate epimerase-like enolase superfamily enzyme
MRAYITASRPAEVAREVERLHKRGCRAFVLRSVNHGGDLDRERLGAARYAAGIQSQVELEGDASSGVAMTSVPGARGAR